jgi:excisionase family DNA binding protein
MEAEAWPSVSDVENLDTWPTKKEVMDRLHMSEKTVERRINEGKIRKRERFIPGRKPLPILHPEDVRALQQQVLIPIAVKNDHPAVPPSTSSRSDIAQVLVPLTALLTKLERNPEAFFPPSLPATPPEKPFLTVKEAAKYSGLPEDYIRRQIASGAIPAIKTNRSTKVNHWMIRWDHLWRHDAVTPSNSAVTASPSSFANGDARE